MKYKIFIINELFSYQALRCANLLNALFKAGQHIHTINKLVIKIKFYS